MGGLFLLPGFLYSCDPMNDPKTDLLGLRYNEFHTLLSALGSGYSELGKLVYSSAFRLGSDAMDASALFGSSSTVTQFTRLEALRCHFLIGNLVETARVSDLGDAGTTTKVLFCLADGESIECVAIPMHGGTWTLCVSSQVGCARGCVFCETGRDGLIRNLEASEIVAQVVYAARALNCRFRNIVFMGMGEPLDNLDNVVQAISVLRDQRGLCYSLERITLCTSGVAEGIRLLGTFGLKRLNLSISLNSALEETRNRIMPINRTIPLDALSAALQSYPCRRNFVFCLNYCLMPGVNDTSEEVAAIATFASKLERVFVNVIPYNPGREPICHAPTDEETDRFILALIAAGLIVKRRQLKGGSVMAACGQLGGRPCNAVHKNV